MTCPRIDMRSPPPQTLISATPWRLPAYAPIRQLSDFGPQHILPLLDLTSLEDCS
jgi:hypothetical protein